MTDNYTGMVYLTVRNDVSQHKDSTRRLKPVKVTQKYPDVLASGEAVVRLRVVIPARAFNALIPTQDVIVDDVQLHMPVEVVQA